MRSAHINHDRHAISPFTAGPIGCEHRVASGVRAGAMAEPGIAAQDSSEGSHGASDGDLSRTRNAGQPGVVAVRPRVPALACLARYQRTGLRPPGQAGSHRACPRRGCSRPSRSDQAGRNIRMTGGGVARLRRREPDPAGAQHARRARGQRLPRRADHGPRGGSDRSGPPGRRGRGMAPALLCFLTPTERIACHTEKSPLAAEG